MGCQYINLGSGLGFKVCFSVRLSYSSFGVNCLMSTWDLNVKTSLTENGSRCLELDNAWRDVCYVKKTLLNGGGVWAVYPVVFSVGNFCGIFHCTVTTILSISTISSFSLAASRSAGPPPSILWGSYPVVGKADELMLRQLLGLVVVHISELATPTLVDVACTDQLPH
ncbi:hypothetical protein BVC80_1771g41 [Macleaya cordata]|uniref:Uncharacterized protein n=1 Tax=Macleaya cordata TaxID=56857 RepID=A0A200QNW0_MACCD|nr:hypothetical protein BVC80_1771g41 [Macleaya cordata]